MSSRPATRDRFEVLRDLMERTATRVVLSALILASLLPIPALEGMRLVFFWIFATELVLRVLLLVTDPAHALGRRRRLLAEMPFLVLDLVATLSFLNWGFDGRFLRLFRLTRLVLLLGYWRSFVGDLWTITWRRERRYQLGFVASVVIIAVVASTVVLTTIETRPFDYDDDGQVTTEDSTFMTRLWWAFRQVEDPGNLIQKPEDGALLAVSLLLTVSGLLVFSFLVGVGTTVVEELVVLGRQRRLGLRNHVVVLGSGRHAHFLLEELVRFQDKHVLHRRLVLFGSTAQRPTEAQRPELARVYYRYGDSSSPADLVRADVDRASLVIVLADEAGGDASVVSRVLAVRQLNERCRVVADVLRPQNERSVHEAGGPNTEVVLTRQFVGLFLTSELISPGVDALFRELLTSVGQELYLAEWDGTPRKVEDHAALVSAAVHRYGVVPLGVRRREVDGFELAPEAGRALDEVTAHLVLARSIDEAQAFGACEEVPEPEAPTARLAGLRLGFASESRRLERLLVCGFREEVGDLVEELGSFSAGLDMRVMVGPGRACFVVDSLLNRVAHAKGGSFRSCDERCVEFVSGDEVRVRVQVFEGDPASDRQLSAVPEVGHDLSETDAVLFVADGGWGLDADAKSALGVLKLFGMMRVSPGDFRPQFRVVSELQEAGKGDLLEGRLRHQRQNGEGEPVDRCAVVSTEKLRHYLLAQTVLVPGIASVYAGLLRESGATLVKLAPTEAGKGEACFDDLVDTLARERLLPLALELVGPDGPQAHVNPAPGEEGYVFDREALVGVFCIAHDSSGGGIVTPR